MAIGQNPCRAALLVARYINIDLAAMEGNICIAEIVVVIVTEGL